MLKNYPFVKQKDLKECGPVCLQMIIMYYKGYINIEELNEICKTNKFGTSAYNLIEGAKEIGFEAYGIKINLEEMNKNNIILPCICHVVLKNKYSHYIVIYEINFKRKILIIADPMDKIKKITFKEFNEIFNNIIFVLYPKKNIPFNKDISLTNFIIDIFKNNKKEFSPLFFLSIILTIFSIISSFFFQFMLNYSNAKSLIILIFIIFIFINLIKHITNYFRNKVLYILNEKIELDLISNTYSKIINLPYHYYKNHTIGDIISRITDLDNIRELIKTLFLSIFMDIPLSIISFIVLYIINDKLFYITFLILLLYSFIIIIFNSTIKTHISIIQNTNSEVTSYLYETINGFETIKGLNIKDKIIKKFTQKYSNLLEHIYKFNNIYNNQSIIKEIIYSLGNMIIIFVGFLLILSDEINIGTLLTFNLILTYLLDPIINVLNLNYNIIESKNSLKRVLNILKEEKDNGIINKKINNIQVKNLTYKIDNYKIIDNLTLDIKAKEKVMLIGSSGSGKSTLLKLFMGYYSVERNQIFYNNIDINDYTKESIHNNFAYISQQEMLFTDTLINNLNICSNDKITHISKLCYVDEIIKNNSLGYNVLIEENGFNISGGQRQRIILARTLLKKSNLLLIDEGLNELDINLERKILKNIFNHFKDKTIIIVSHRLENMDLFDKVININTKEELIKNI